MQAKCSVTGGRQATPYWDKDNYSGRAGPVAGYGHTYMDDNEQVSQIAMHMHASIIDWCKCNCANM